MPFPDILTELQKLLERALRGLLLLQRTELLLYLQQTYIAANDSLQNSHNATNHEDDMGYKA
jgi:hypothetical protein